MLNGEGFLLVDLLAKGDEVPDFFYYSSIVKRVERPPFQRGTTSRVSTEIWGSGAGLPAHQTDRHRMTWRGRKGAPSLNLSTCRRNKLGAARPVAWESGV